MPSSRTAQRRDRRVSSRLGRSSSARRRRAMGSGLRAGTSRRKEAFGSRTRSSSTCSAAGSSRTRSTRRTCRSAATSTTGCSRTAARRASERPRRRPNVRVSTTSAGRRLRVRGGLRVGLVRREGHRRRRFDRALPRGLPEQVAGRALRVHGRRRLHGGHGVDAGAAGEVTYTRLFTSPSHPPPGAPPGTPDDGAS